MAALGVVLVTTSSPLILKQEQSQLVISSPLVEKIRGNLPLDSRYAVAAPGISSLPPNFNATLGLASIHSKNSLSSSRYHTLIKSLGGDVNTYGRHNKTIEPNYSGSMFWMSNIGLILSPQKINHQNLDSLGQESGVHLYRVKSRMGESIQVLPLQLDINEKEIRFDDPRNMTWFTSKKVLDQGDLLEFEIKPSKNSVFILSQKFHRDWEALVQTNNGWKTAQTVEINGVFLGVLLPEGSLRLRLDFKALSRYAWIAHIFWVLLILLIGFNIRSKFLEKN